MCAKAWRLLPQVNSDARDLDKRWRPWGSPRRRQLAGPTRPEPPSSRLLPHAPNADTGTRPGLHGQTLLSSGHPDLDRLLGGGLPLGSLLLLLEDGWSQHHATLLRYFLAEGAACGQVRYVCVLRCQRHLARWLTAGLQLKVGWRRRSPPHHCSPLFAPAALCSRCCWLQRRRWREGCPSSFQPSSELGLPRHVCRMHTAAAAVLPGFLGRLKTALTPLPPPAPYVCRTRRRRAAAAAAGGVRM